VSLGAQQDTVKRYNSYQSDELVQKILCLFEFTINIVRKLKCLRLVISCAGNGFIPPLYNILIYKI
jgi:hypothetical protein